MRLALIKIQGVRCDIKIIDPLKRPGWNELIQECAQSSFFHSSEWAQTLSESYRYTPIYLAIFRGNRLAALAPIMEIESMLTGRRGVSLPFTDYCTPIYENEEDLAQIIDYLIRYGHKRRWKTLELRSDTPLPTAYPCSSQYYGHNLDLSADEVRLFRGCRENTRRNIKKARQEGVEIEISSSFAGIKEFYRLNCLTRKDHGVPPQPFSFFEKVYEHIISKDKGFVVLASYRRKAVAGAVYFHFAKKAIYKYGASDRAYQNLRANNYVMWEAIRWYLRHGYESFHFGRTELGHDGLRQFKNGWGGRESTITYYKYDFRRNTFVLDAKDVTAKYTNVFRNMPLPFLKLAGSLLYRHVA